MNQKKMAKNNLNFYDILIILLIKYIKKFINNDN